MHDLSLGVKTRINSADNCLISMWCLTFLIMTQLKLIFALVFMSFLDYRVSRCDNVMCYMIMIRVQHKYNMKTSIILM